MSHLFLPLHLKEDVIKELKLHHEVDDHNSRRTEVGDVRIYWTRPIEEFPQKGEVEHDDSKRV